MPETTKKTTASHSKARLILLLFYGAAVILPVIMMFSQMRSDTLRTLTKSPVFAAALINSVSVTSFVTIIVLLCAFYTAWAIRKWNIPHKHILEMLFTVPMLIPSISHGMGLINLLGTNGIITKILGFDIGLYGFRGIALGSFLYSFPVAYIILSDSIRYMDGSLYDVAEVMGIPKRGIFTNITLPYMKRPIISALFAVFTMVFTDYGVPLAVGGRYDTLPVYLYKEVIGRLDFSIGAYIGIILIIPALISFVIDIMQGENEGVVNAHHSTYKTKATLRDTTASVLCGLIAILIVLPIISFAVYSSVVKYPVNLTLTLEHLNFTISNGMIGALSNSVLIAVGTAIVGTAVSYLTAYATARMKKDKTSALLHLISLTSLAVPGIVLGLGYIVAFKSTFLYGTIIILIFVNTAHFGATPYLMCRNALQKLDCNLETVARTLGIPLSGLFTKVIVPSTTGTIIEMASYFFINAMMTISAVAFLFTVNNKPLALLIPQFESQLSYEATAVVSLIILVVNLTYRLAATKIREKITEGVLK